MIADIEQLPLEGRRVLVRVDFDVPLTPRGEVGDDARIRESLPTLGRLLERGAALVVASHLGRPGGRADPRWSMEPVAARLCELLERTVIFADDCMGDGVLKQALALEPGQILFLENVRFHPGEEPCEEAAAKGFAALAEAYVNDSFASLALGHASTAGVARHLKVRGAGIGAKRELDRLSRLRRGYARPYVAVVGGARFSDKARLLESLLTRVDVLCVGGATAHTLLAAKGVSVGASRIDRARIPAARTLLDAAAQRGVQVLLPVDHRAGAGAGATQATAVDGEALPEGLAGLDIGPRTVDLFARALAGARTVLWSGPVGLAESAPFAAGTNALAQALGALQGAHRVAVGADTAAAALRATPAAAGYASGAGQAALDYLEGRTLPGLAALEE